MNGVRQYDNLAKRSMVVLMTWICMFTMVSKPLVAQTVSLAFDKHVGVVDSCKNPTNITGVHPIFLPKAPVYHQRYVFSRKDAALFQPASFDLYFYFLCGLLLFLGFTLRAFPKYYADLYRVFSQSGFRQKSIRDQLLQNKVASLGLNTLFFLTGGTYIYLISRYNSILPDGVWYFHIFICVCALIAIYGIKYISLGLGGWIFSAKELVNSYSFLVFFVNKIAGLLLLPVIVVLWLGSENLHPFFVVTSLLVVGFLILYRYFLILPLVRNRSGVSSFHFFIYLCCFELLPIALMVKFLVNFF